MFQVAAIEELVHHLNDDGMQITVPGLVALLINIKKRVEVKTDQARKGLIVSAICGKLSNNHLTIGKI
jgi:hypothetical protein